MNKILIIKHGALGDIAFSLPVIYSIIKNYPGASIDLLTEKKYYTFLNKSKYFHNIIIDNRVSNIFKIILLLSGLIKNKYELIIDLQNSNRTSYYHLFFRIFSNSKICSSRIFSHFKYNIPEQGYESVTQGLYNQIKLLKIIDQENVDYSWLKTSLNTSFQKNLILIIPGVSKNGISKQWDPKKFGNLAKYIEDKNFQICVVGNSIDIKSINPIIHECKNIIKMIDNSPPEVIYSLALISKLIITNDTGPGHIASLAGKNILWLLNDNKISKANISNRDNFYKVMSSSIKKIKLEDVIKVISDNNLLQ